MHPNSIGDLQRFPLKHVLCEVRNGQSRAIQMGWQTMIQLGKALLQGKKSCGKVESQKSVDHFLMENAEPGRVLLVSRRLDDFALVRRWLLYNHFSFVVEVSLVGIVNALRSSEYHGGMLQDYVIVDLEENVDLDHLIDQLFVLREYAPETRVILVSANFKCDDFDLERLSICDVSLRWPVSLARLELGLVMACFNNNIWSETRRDALKNGVTFGCSDPVSDGSGRGRI